MNLMKDKDFQEGKTPEELSVDVLETGVFTKQKEKMILISCQFCLK